MTKELDAVLASAIGILANIITMEIEIPMLKLYVDSAKVLSKVRLFEVHEFVLCSIFSDRWSKMELLIVMHYSARLLL